MKHANTWTREKFDEMVQWKIANKATDVATEKHFGASSTTMLNLRRRYLGDTPPLRRGRRPGAINKPKLKYVDIEHKTAEPGLITIIRCTSDQFKQIVEII
jgi:hypothetical protein